MSSFKKRTYVLLRFLIFFSLAIAILSFIYRDFIADEEKQKELEKAMQSGIKYEWIVVSLIAFFISQISRALRWGLLIETLGKKTRFSNTFCAVVFGYLMNTVLPRAGEVSRCIPLKQYEKISLSSLIGTVVTERVVDLLLLLVLVLSTLFISFGRMETFFFNLSQEHGFSISVYHNALYILLLLFALGVATIYLFRKLMRNTKIYQKINAITAKFVDGLKSIRNIPSWRSFIMHSLIVWVMYVGMIFFMFKAFSFSESLTFGDAIFICVMSSLGMIIPMPGGIGTYHFFVIQGLLLFQIGQTDAKIFALISHTTITIVGVIIPGILALVALPILNKKKN